MTKEELKEFIEKMSHETRAAISKDYDNGMKVKDILEKYCITVSTNQFSQMLLLKDTELMCPYCNLPMYVKRQRVYSYRDNPLFCVNCGHINQYNLCECIVCSSKRQEDKQKEELARQKILEEKRDKIIKLWNSGDERVKIDDLSVLQKIYVGTLMNSSFKSTIDILTPIHDCENIICPTENATFMIS